MKLRMPTASEVIAASRHGATSIASVIGTLAAMKLVTGGDAASLQSSLDQISHGVAEIATAVAAIAVTTSAAYASLSANPIVQMMKGLFFISKNPAAIEEVKQAASLEQKAALVATTDNLDEVKGVPLKPTAEGREIENLVPSQTAAVTTGPAPGEGVAAAASAR